MRLISRIDPLAWVGQCYLQMLGEAVYARVPPIEDFIDIRAPLPSLRDRLELLKASCASNLIAREEGGHVS